MNTTSSSTNESDKNSKGSFKNYTSNHKKKVLSVAWNSVGNLLASGSADSSIRIWNLQESNLEKGIELKGHSDSVSQISWNPTNPNILGSVSADKSFRLWDVRSSKPIHIEKSKVGNINIAWSPCGNKIAVGNKEDYISFFDYKGGSVALTKSIKLENEIYEISWNNTGTVFFVTSSADTLGPVLVLDGVDPSNQPLETLECHKGRCYCIAVDPQGKYFSTGASDAIVAVWDMNEMICIQTYTELEGEIQKLSFSYDGNYIATVSDLDSINIFVPSTGLKTHTVAAWKGGHAVAWHPSKYLLAFGGEEKRDDKSRTATGDEGIVGLFIASF